jgi:hypothetical protein
MISETKILHATADCTALESNRGWRGKDTANNNGQVEGQVSGVDRTSTALDTKEVTAGATDEALCVSDGLREEELNLAEIARGTRGSTSLSIGERRGQRSIDNLTHVTEHAESLRTTCGDGLDSLLGRSLGGDHKARGVVADNIGRRGDKLTSLASKSGER